MLDIDEKTLKEKAKEIGADYLICDVRRYKDIEAAVLYAKDKYGSVDITVSYAGGCPSRVCKAGKNFNDLPIEVIDWGVEVNFRAPLYIARAAFNIMRDQKRGVIINISSIDALTGSNAADYSAEKSGLYGLTKSIALLGAPHGVRCCCVTPGPVLTRLDMANMKPRSVAPQKFGKLSIFCTLFRQSRVYNRCKSPLTAAVNAEQETDME